jgi:Flp pilus assembly protein TadD
MEQKPTSDKSKDIHKQKDVNSSYSLYLLLGLFILVIVVGLVITRGGAGSNVNNAAVSDGSSKSQFDAGNEYFRQGNLEKAVEAYQKTIELDPTNQGAYVNLGVAYYQQEKFDLAEAQYRKALELKPDDGEVAYNLGALYLQQALMKGDPPDQAGLAKAVKQLEQAIYLAPHLAEPLFSLGVAYRGLGQKDKAIETFQKFLDQKPKDSTAVQEAGRYLKELKGN